MKLSGIRAAGMPAAFLVTCFFAFAQVVTADRLSAGDTTESMTPAIEVETTHIGGPWAREVLGTVSVSFFPTVLASLPGPPMALTLGIESVEDHFDLEISVPSSSATWEVRDGGATTHQDFSFFLVPGTYEMTFVQLEADSLSNRPLELPFPLPRFTVPDEGCVYFGRILLATVRLPPGSLEQTRSAVGAMARQKDKAFVYIYLSKGSLIPASFAIDVPSDAEVKGGAKLVAEAREKGCVIELATLSP